MFDKLEDKQKSASVSQPDNSYRASNTQMLIAKDKEAFEKIADNTESNKENYQDEKEKVKEGISKILDDFD